MAIYNLANVLKYSGAPRLACNKYREALACAEDGSDPQLQIAILLAIANECLDDAANPIGQIDGLLNKVARLAPEEDRLKPEMRWSLETARAKRAAIQNDLPDTISCFRRALTWARQSGNRANEAEALFILAKGLMAEGNSTEAINILTEAEQMMIEIGDHRVGAVRDALLYITQENKAYAGNSPDITILTSEAERSATGRNTARSSTPEVPIAQNSVEQPYAKVSNVEGYSAERNTNEPMSLENSSNFPIYFLPQGASLIDSKIDEIREALPQNGGTLCIVHDEGAYVGFVPDGEGLQVVKTQTLGPRGLIESDKIDRRHIPTLLQITAPIVRSGIAHRLSLNYEQAIAAYNFSLQVAILDQNAQGVCNIASNLLRCWLDLTALGRGAVWRPRVRADKPDSVTDDRLLPVSIEAGNLIMSPRPDPKRAEGSHVQMDTPPDREPGRGARLLAAIATIASAVLPDVERLVELSVSRMRDKDTLALLLALHRLLLVSAPDLTLEQGLIPAWAGGGMVGPGPSDHDFRRRTLTSEIFALAHKLDRFDTILETIYLELGSVFLSEILRAIGVDTSPSSKFTKLAEGAETPHDFGFNLIWKSYERFRHEVPHNTSSPEVIGACSAAITHLSRLRALTLASGTWSAHVLSYHLTLFISKVSRDFVTLLLANNLYDEALVASEETCSRALSDWMARTHLTNRLLLRQGFTGSVGEVHPATLEEIVHAAKSTQSLILFFIAIEESFHVCLVAPNSEIIWDKAKLPDGLLEQLFQSLPYGIDSIIGSGGVRSFDMFFLDLSSSRKLDDLLD